MEKVVHQPNSLLSRQEVGKALGLSPQTVARLAQAGELESVKISERNWRITSESLKAYLSRKGVS